MEVTQMNQIECAVSCFQEGFSCAQAVFSAYGPQNGLDRELALKVAGAFGGGMGHMGHVCGAVTGAFMVIGLKYGKTQPEDNESRDKTYSLVQEFTERFKSHHGSILCRELLGCDISTPAALEMAREKGLFETLCPRLVQDAAEIIEEILE
jgi:C_GCAxxG_C_C family probable redox protein